MASHFTERKMSREEPVEQYVYDVKEEGITMAKSEQEVLQQVLNNLHPTIKPFVLSKQPQSLSDVVQYGRMAEAFLDVRGKRY